MNDFLSLFNELKGVVGGIGAVAIAAAVYFWRERGQRELQGANNDANISAIEHWKVVADRSDVALANMTARADKFAEERNEAYRALSKMEGQIAEMTRQLEAQSAELAALRLQITRMEVEINAKQ